jgi:hypothetical protein
LFGCPLYSESDWEGSKSLAIPMLPFFAGTLELFSSISFNQRINCLSVVYHTMVRRNASPAFALFHDVSRGFVPEVCQFYIVDSGKTIAPRRLDRSLRYSGLELAFQHLPIKLDALLKSGQVLPNEKDGFGNTLIFVS